LLLNVRRSLSTELKTGENPSRFAFTSRLESPQLVLFAREFDMADILLRTRFDCVLARAAVAQLQLEEMNDLIAQTWLLISRTGETIVRSDALIDALHECFIGSAKIPCGAGK
jgi:hypothetical protein